MRYRLKRLIKETVRDLRKNQTQAEAILWQELRNRKLVGKKFLRQHPLVFQWEGKERFLVPDFCCHEAKLIVELDGGVHSKQKDYDILREGVLKELGFRTLRFNNSAVIKNLAIVLIKIKSQLNPN